MTSTLLPHLAAADQKARSQVLPSQLTTSQLAGHLGTQAMKAPEIARPVPLHQMPIQEVMTSPAVTVGRATTLAQAAALLTFWQVSTAPVVDEGGVLVGVVTATDLIRGVLAPASHQNDAGGVWSMRNPPTTVEQVMSWPVATVEVGDDVAFAVFLFLDPEIRCLPVTQNGCVVGVVTRQDLLGAS
ncbi:CBS domain-containing protein [Nakamurella antarctica]|uniref:CBS domain-containing protein n=1 Tax=Nakamurella antarctica TaxID=1902245 RepID=A0A3G8ZJ16_9ACTN|nr:CBS domain-containing protein [Nakamurella antarctica]AZI57210.1 CBS domain-containing protein [Nakamurella antarctica]